MKNDIFCERCMYKQIPSHFSPCLGCKGNMDILKEQNNKRQVIPSGRCEMDQDNNRCI